MVHLGALKYPKIFIQDSDWIKCTPFFMPITLLVVCLRQLQETIRYPYVNIRSYVWQFLKVAFKTNIPTLQITITSSVYVCLDHFNLSFMVVNCIFTLFIINYLSFNFWAFIFFFNLFMFCDLFMIVLWFIYVSLFLYYVFTNTSWKPTHLLCVMCKFQ